jgi:hypothetical protein
MWFFKEAYEELVKSKLAVGFIVTVWVVIILLVAWTYL